MTYYTILFSKKKNVGERGRAPCSHHLRQLFGSLPKVNTKLHLCGLHACRPIVNQGRQCQQRPAVPRLVLQNQVSAKYISVNVEWVMTNWTEFHPCAARLLITMGGTRLLLTYRNLTAATEPSKTRTPFSSVTTPNPFV